MCMRRKNTAPGSCRKAHSSYTGGKETEWGRDWGVCLIFQNTSKWPVFSPGCHFLCFLESHKIVPQTEYQAFNI